MYRCLLIDKRCFKYKLFKNLGYRYLTNFSQLLYFFTPLPLKKKKKKKKRQKTPDFMIFSEAIEWNIRLKWVNSLIILVRVHFEF